MAEPLTGKAAATVGGITEAFADGALSQPTTTQAAPEVGDEVCVLCILART